MKESRGRFSASIDPALPSPVFPAPEDIQRQHPSAVAVVAEPDPLHVDVDEPGELEELDDLVDFELDGVLGLSPRRGAR